MWKNKMSINNNNLLEVVQTRASLLKKNNLEQFKAVVFEERKPKKSVTKPIDDDKVKNKIINKNNTDENSSINFDEMDPEMEFEMNRRKKRKTDDTEFDIKKARHEVINFAISSSNIKDKKNSQIALAIKLGAKPPKKSYKNYKELLQEKKIENDKKEQAGKFSLIGKNQYGASVTKCSKKPRRIVSQISKHYGVANPKLKKR